MNTRPIGIAWIVAATAGLASSPAEGQVTDRLSVDAAGVEGNDDSWWAVLSGDGRFVAFHSRASNLVPSDTNGWLDVFVRDRLTGSIERVSVDGAGLQGNGESSYPAISASGRFVAFESWAPLVSGDSNGLLDIFVRDRLLGTTERVSVASWGAEADAVSWSAAISADGRVVAFTSGASNLVYGDFNDQSDVFAHDRATGSTERVSVTDGGQEANNWSDSKAISADGRYVAFGSDADNLVSDDYNHRWDIFVRDRELSTTERASLDNAGREADQESYAPSISADGRFVTFLSRASTFVTGDDNGWEDVFVRDRFAGLTERVSVSSTGAESDGESLDSAISADGRIVAFMSRASNLVANDTNGNRDIFRHDRATGTTTRVSVATGGAQAHGESYVPTISADGRFVAFWSGADDLAPNDTNQSSDVFVHGPWLTLEADRESLPPGATVSLSTWTGAPTGLVLLVVVGVDDAAMFVPVLVGAFDAAGAWMRSETVPPGLSGTVWTLQSFGFVPTGKAAASNPEVLTFE